MSDRACWEALCGRVPPVEGLQYVKWVDNLMLAAERAQVMLSEADGGLAWGDLPEWPRFAATDLSAPCWTADLVSEEDIVQQGLVTDLICDLNERVFLCVRTGGAFGVEVQRLTQQRREAEAEAWELQLRQAWLRRYRLLCGLLGVRECPL